jgi:hypothetical protein
MKMAAMPHPGPMLKARRGGYAPATARFSAGARKLAHYVEREVQRWMNSRSVPDAVALPAEPKTEAPIDAAKGAQPGPHTRPLSGPTVPLTGERRTESEELLDGESLQTIADALAAKVLVRGEAIPAPAGRADDFAWPQRDVAAVGGDPVVTTTDLPMTPMVAQREGTRVEVSAAEATSAAARRPQRVVARRTPRQVYANAQWMYRPDYRRQSPLFQPFGYQSMLGSRW